MGFKMENIKYEIKYYENSLEEIRASNLSNELKRTLTDLFDYKIKQISDEEVNDREVYKFGIDEGISLIIKNDGKRLN